MSLVREPGSMPIVEFTVPFAGTWNSIAANMIVPAALYQSMNVYIRKGKLRNRPGLELLNTFVFDDPVIGGDMAVMPGGDKMLLAFTRKQLFTLRVQNSTWQARDVLNFAASDDSIIDVCFLESGGDYVGIIANGEDTLKFWINASGVDPITATVGTVPRAKSVCIAARRVIALVNPHTIRWSAIFDYNNWSDLNYNKIAQTNDEAICVRALGTLDFVIYKERSIYLAKAQAGSDASAFAVKYIQRCEGPAGIRAVIDADGQHFYMTASGRIGMFDGSSLVRWVADGLWLHMQADLDPAYTHKIFGVYDYRLHLIMFYYPRIGDNGLMKGCMLINIPLQGSNIEGYAAFMAIMALPMTHGYEMRFEGQIARALTFSGTPNDQQSFRLNEDVFTDDSMPYDCSFQTGLFPMPEMKHHMINVESFFERAAGNGHVLLEPVKSDALETEIGTVDFSGSSILDLEHNPVQEYIGLLVTGRFFGLKYSWTSESDIRYGGARVYGRPLS